MVTGGLEEEPARVHPSIQAAGRAPGAALRRSTSSGTLQRSAWSLQNGAATKACRSWSHSATCTALFFCPAQFYFLFIYLLNFKSLNWFLIVPVQARCCSGEPFPGRRWSRDPNSELRSVMIRSSAQVHCRATAQEVFERDQSDADRWRFRTSELPCWASPAEIWIQPFRKLLGSCWATSMTRLPSAGSMRLFRRCSGGEPTSGRKPSTSCTVWTLDSTTR